MKKIHNINWEKSNKKLIDLIAVLQSFKDQELEVLLSVDGGLSTRPITMVGNNMGRCLLNFHLWGWQSYVSPETGLPKSSIPKYLVCGKKISGLIDELQTFENMDRIVEISVDDKENCYPISRIEQRGRYCLLMFCPSES